MIKKCLFISLLSAYAHIIYAQEDSVSVAMRYLQEQRSKTPVNKKRLLLLSGSSAVLYTGSFIALNKAWYADYPRSPFHFFNDNGEWNQVDKIGHAWTSYQISRVSTDAWRWTGLPESKSVLLGSISGIAYQTIIEIQDGFSRKWGFSIGDMGANVFGVGVFMLQEMKWREQRLAIKFSYWPHRYENDLLDRRNQLFGKTFNESILKDYNSQSYWLSGNLRLLMPGTNLPPWLNLAFGYRAEGMLGGTENAWIDSDGNRVERKDIERIRRYFISPDIDFTKIKTHKRLLRQFFFVLNAVKLPAPALEFNSKGKLSFHGVYY